MSGQRIAADPMISAFVTANAGSGKTKTLIDRTARLLLRKVKPETILCVTYTKAAAAEMQRRLFGLLGDWSVAEDAALAETLTELTGETIYADDHRTLSEARRLFAQALETPGGLKIQTIHAFCERVLRRFPLEAGVPPSFDVIDDAAAASIAAAARAEMAEAVLRNDSAFLSEAYSRFSIALDFQSFQAMFAAFETERGAIAEYIGKHGGLGGAVADVWRVCGFFDGPEDPEAIAQQAVARLDLSSWRAAAAHFIELGKDLKCAEALAAAVREPSFEAALNAMFTAGGKGTPATVFTRSAALRARPELQEALLVDQAGLEEARSRIFGANIARDTGHALALAHLYAVLYENEKQWRGVLDFADLVRKTCELLRDNPAAAWVLYKLDGGVDHILLDEAQDTAPEQWTILKGLTGEFFSGDGRPSDRGTPRSLFIVGDEKQSIYSFQGADPKRLRAETDAYVALITASGRTGRGVPLEESWRSVGQILTFVDTVFAPDDLRDAVQAGNPAPVSHLLTRKDHAGCVDVWEPEREVKEDEREAWEAPLDTVSVAMANRRLADRIASEIDALVKRGDAVFDKERKAHRGAAFGDVLILVRRRGVLFEEILRAMKRRGIPVAGADRLALSAHIAFDDLLALARFALFPGDELTLAALLKSPFCGLDDDSLYALAHGREKEKLWDRLRRRAGENAGWTKALAFLEGVIAEAGSRRPFDFYQRVLGRLDGDGRSGRMRLLARLGHEAGDAIDEFVAQVLAAEGRGARDLETLSAELASLDITVKREMDSGRGEVRVMTAHGAKGLEAPIVILPEMTLSRTARGGALLRTQAGGFLWAPRMAEDCEASAAAREARKLAEEQERMRLFYVALTRARDRLILCGRVAFNAKLENIGGWYGAAEDALGQLGEGVRVLPTADGGTFRRYGPDPVAAPSFRAGEPKPLVTPDWLFAAARTEVGGVRYVSPSALAENAKDPAVSPLDAAQGLGRFRRGNIIHKLLQLLPDVEPAARAGGAAALLSREPGLDQAQREEMAAAALGVLDDDRFAAVFGPGSRAEVAVAGEAAALPAGMAIGGRIDRLVVEQDRVLVIDFKTNRPAPARIEEADRAYLMQMAAYVAVLREAFPGRRVEAALVWTDGPKLMPVPENLLIGALAELAVTA